ncbi:MAG TPA: hypothetical protein VK453_01220 [Micromonosporaceae bacterium]|nr:hypothetical protein [Micromonosporaceae bacterium]
MPGLPRRGALRRRCGALAAALSLLWTLAAAQAPALAAPSAAVRVSAADVEIGPTYWQGGAGATTTVVITVTNPGSAVRDVQGTYTLPPGVRRTGTTGGGGCAHLPPQGFRCTFPPGAQSGTLSVRVVLEPDAWRLGPLTGALSATVGGVVTTDSYTLILPPGPPSNEIMTAVENVTLRPAVAASPEFTTMTVRVANAAGVDATGALEIVTPAGLDLVYFPVGCIGHRELSPTRDRCELGTVKTDGETLLIFKLRVEASARSAVPGIGVVYGILAPAGRPVLTSQATYRMLAGTTDAGSANGTVAPSPALNGSGANGSGPNGSASAAPAAPGTKVAARRDDVSSKPLDAGWIVGSLVGLVVLAGVVVVLSLRRRMQSDL